MVLRLCSMEPLPFRDTNILQIKNMTAGVYFKIIEGGNRQKYR